MNIISGMYACMGLLFVALGYPLVLRRIPPNPFYGFRTPRTMKPGNERIWYEANAYTGRLLQWVGCWITGSTLVLSRVSYFTVDTYAYACLSSTIAGLVVMVVLSFKYLATLK